MANNKRRKYLVIAEVERMGFVAGFHNKYWDAVKLANELLLYGELFQWCEPEKICIELWSRGFKSYQIKGNQLYFDKGIYSSTDGQYSVKVLAVNKSEFCLEVFIRERENHSIVFEPELWLDKRWMPFFEKFPSLSHIAN